VGEPLDELHREATTSLDQRPQTPRQNERMHSIYPQGWNFIATLLRRGIPPARTSTWVPPTATNRFDAYRYNWCHARGVRSSEVIDRNLDLAPRVTEGLVIGGIPFRGSEHEGASGGADHVAGDRSPAPFRITDKAAGGSLTDTAHIPAELGFA
jgi:hypothetical protein